MTYKKYLASEQWAIVARQAKKRAGFRCQLCNQSGELHAHHRTYERLGDEGDADVTVLCRECHARFHDKISSDKEEWLAAVARDSPIVYNCLLGQSDGVHLDATGRVWVMFGVSASDRFLALVDGRKVCGREIRIAKTLMQSDGLTVSIQQDSITGEMRECVRLR